MKANVRGDLRAQKSVISWNEDAGMPIYVKSAVRTLTKVLRKHAIVNLYVAWEGATMMKKIRRGVEAKRKRNPPIARYLRISGTSGSKAGLMEILGALTLGSAVVPRYTEHFSHGLRGDMEALGYDYHKVLGKVNAHSDQKRIAAE